MKTIRRAAWAITLLTCTASVIAAPEEEPPSERHNAQIQQYLNAEHLLDGMNFQYFYDAGGGLKIAFAEGKLQYEWISGPRKGTHAENIPYQSRKIGDEVYLINWHQPDKPDFVSLVIDLKEKRLYSSAILRYGTGNEMIHFKEAAIKNIKKTFP